MAETKRMTAEQVVGYLLEGEGLDFHDWVDLNADLSDEVAVEHEQLLMTSPADVASQSAVEG